MFNISPGNSVLSWSQFYPSLLFSGDLEVRRAQRISSMIASAICLIEVKCEILNVPVFDKEIH